jgi:hypothetical protein
MAAAEQVKAFLVRGRVMRMEAYITGEQKCSSTEISPKARQRRICDIREIVSRQASHCHASSAKSRVK